MEHYNFYNALSREDHHAEAQRTQRAIGNAKARFFFHIYFDYENKKKHIGNRKFCNNAQFSAPPRALREDNWSKK
jgi:hypothetical protein